MSPNMFGGVQHDPEYDPRYKHVCGAQGYDQTIDPPCPGCVEAGLMQPEEIEDPMKKNLSINAVTFLLGCVVDPKPIKNECDLALARGLEGRDLVHPEGFGGSFSELSIPCAYYAALTKRGEVLIQMILNTPLPEPRFVDPRTESVL